MKTLISSLLIALVGCGGQAIDDDRIVLPLEEGQFEQEQHVQDKFQALASAGFQMGTTTSHARFQCDRSTSGQVCTIPLTKNPTYFIDTDITNPTLVRNLFSALDTQLSTWSWTETTNQSTATIQVNSVPCSGNSSSNNIESFGCVNVTAQGNNLTEGANVVGSYTNHSFCVVHVDQADINAKFANSTSRNRLFVHALGHAVTACMGLGSRSTAPAKSITSRPVDVSGPIIQNLSNGELCRADSYLTTANGTFTQPSICVGSD